MPLRRIAQLAAALLALAVLAASAGAVERPPGFGFGRIVGGPGDEIDAIGRGFNVAAVHADGTPVLSFGDDGYARALFKRFDGAQSIDGARVRHGGVVLGGHVILRCRHRRGAHCGYRPALARFRPSGRLDPGFGRGGMVVVPRGASFFALAPLPSGKLLAVGKTRDNLPMIARFAVGGGLDPGFGRGGIEALRRLPGLGRLHDGRADEIALMPDGRPVVAVYATTPTARVRGLLRLDRDGGVDRGFAADGFLTEPPSGLSFEQWGLGLAALPDGDLLVATGTAEYPRHAGLFRLTPDGRVDRAYGEDGVALGPLSYAVRFNLDLALRPGGGALLGIAGFLSSAMAGFLPDGSLDRGFGAEGLAPQAETWGSRASVVVLPDGGIALGDSDRQLSRLIVSRYDARGVSLGGFAVPQP